MHYRVLEKKKVNSANCKETQTIFFSICFLFFLQLQLRRRSGYYPAPSIQSVSRVDRHDALLMSACVAPGEVKRSRGMPQRGQRGIRLGGCVRGRERGRCGTFSVIWRSSSSWLWGLGPDALWLASDGPAKGGGDYKT